MTKSSFWKRLFMSSRKRWIEDNTFYGMSDFQDIVKENKLLKYKHDMLLVENKRLGAFIDTMEQQYDPPALHIYSTVDDEDYKGYPNDIKTADIP